MKFTYNSGSRPLEGYTVKRGVGHGGFGEVYYAVSDGGKEVALKLVQRNLDVELRGVAQCMNLKHPNLVTLYDLRTSEAGENFVVMEYVSGKCLSEVLEENPQGLPLEEVNRWLKGICAGIGYLHDKGIVHRDLKPGNLFIEDGVAKIGDYGLSKFITASRRSGQTESVGTVHYMAPEISRGKYDREIDVYATGIMLFEMITGHVPFEGESVGEILMKHLTAQPDVSKLPRPYDQVVSQALAKDPTSRFRTMEEFALSLNGRLIDSGTAGKLKKTVAYVPPLGEANHDARAQSQDAPKATNTYAPSPGIAEAADWLAGIRNKAIAWYERPWRATDYFLALMCLIAIAAATGAAVAGIGPLLVAAIMAVGIVFIVTKFVKKKSIPVAAASPVNSPVILNPVHVSTATMPVTSPTLPSLVAPPNIQPPETGFATQSVQAHFAPTQPAIRMMHAPRPNTPKEIPLKPARMRLAESTSAMLLTTVLSALASVFAASLMKLGRKEEWALLAGTCLAGCWAVLIPAKIWEGRAGDAVLRRLVMGALGLGVGMWCSFLDGVLQVGWLNDPKNMPGLLEPLEWMPKLLSDASFFGLVFLIPRWWLIADAKRGLKFNPWLAIVPCFWAWMISLVWSGPHGDPLFWGVVVTGMVAVLVQLATPWEDSAARRRVAQEPLP